MSTTLIHVDLSTTIGALEIGSIFSVFLFGILTLQTHYYYTTFSKDRWPYKVLVTLVWLLEFGHTACVNYEVYRTTITLYGRPQLLVKFPGLEVLTIFGGLITWVAQSFFARRIYYVLPRPYNFIGIFCLVASAVRLVGSAYLTSAAVRSISITQYRVEYKWLISTLLASGVVIDIIIASSMLYYLASKRDKSSRVIKLIDRLIGYTIRTGLLTSISATTMLIAFQLMPTNLIWLALYTFLAKLYSNSLLSALNARQYMSDDVRSTMDYPMSNPRTTKNRRNTEMFVPTAISIEMKTTTESDRDDLPDKSERGVV